MKCKKLFALLLSLCMIVSTFVTVSSATPLTITVGDAEAAAGDTITIPVSLSNNTAGLCGLTLNFTYDADVLAYANAEAGEALPDMALTKPGASFTEGSLNFLWDSMDSDFTNGEILTLTFNVADDAVTGDYAIDVDIRVACDFDYNDLESEAVSGTVSVDGLEPTPTPTPTPTPDAGIEDGNVINIEQPLDAVGELTWVASGSVTVAEADGIGGRDNVLKVTGLANSNNNTVGIKLPDGFAFQEGDVIAYSLDVYSESEINPDLWLRNHPALAPFAQFSHEPLAPNTWTTVTKTVTYEEMVTISTGGGSTGAFNTVGNYALYVRPRQNAGAVYLDNFKIAVTREGYEPPIIPDVTPTPDADRGNVIDITADDVAGLTMKGANVTLTGGQTIGGRDNVIKAEGVANSNDGIVGVKLPDGFAFEANDILTYSVDVYSETANYKPDIYVRDHSDWNPMAVIYGQPSTANEWKTLTKTVTVAELDAIVSTVNSNGTFASTGNYAIYIRPRDCSTLYLDNFVVTVSREGYEEPVIPDVTPTPTPTPGPDTPSEGVTILDIDLPLDSATELTWVTEDVTVSDADGIGGRDNVVKAEGVGDGNTKTVGVKLGDDFKFQAGDVITYSVDLYSTQGLNPDIWLRNHTNLPTFLAFYNTPMETNTWNTITKTVTYDELVASGVSGWTDAGEYALYVRPRNDSVIYLDNFKVKVVGMPREDVGGDDSGNTDTPAPSTGLEVKGYLSQGAPTIQQSILNYTFVDGTFKVDVKELALYNNGQNMQANSFVRVIPETPINVNSKFKISFNVETAGIADVSKIAVAARLFEDATGTAKANTIGWLRGEVKTNIEGGVTVVLSNESGLDELGGSSSSNIVSFGIGLDVQAIANANNSAEDAYIKIGNVKLEYISEIEKCEVIGTATDGVTLNVEFKSAVVADSIKNACAINGIAWNPELITVVVDENNNKKATVTITGLASSTEYELVLSDTITPTTTKTFKTLDAATVTTTCSADTVSYSIINNASSAVDIYAVLLRCKGNTVIESKVISPADGGCASGATLTGTINAGTIGEGEYVKFFAWTADDGKVNSLAPSQIFE